MTAKVDKNRQPGPRPSRCRRISAACNRGGGLLPDRARLGTMAAVVADALSARLCEENGGTAAWRLPRCAARDHRSTGPEILPQCLRLLLGRGRQSIPLAAIDSVGAMGRGRTAPHGRATAAFDGSGCCVAWPGGISPCRLRWFWGSSSISSEIRAAMCRRRRACGFRRPTARSPRLPRFAHDDFVGGPAVRIGIFLSIFNVHLNRSPVAARVIALRYSPGEFLNALRPESALRNENMWIALGRRFAAAPAPGRAADFRRHRPADRLRFAAGRNGPAGACFRHDQARLADETDRACGRWTGSESPRRAEGEGRNNSHGRILRRRWFTL